MAMTEEQTKYDASVESGDPVHEHNGQWWFWNEIWFDRLGPFISEIEARMSVHTYCKEVLGWEPTAVAATAPAAVE